MDRLELIREQTDAVIQKLIKEEERKFAYIHTYGVAQAAAMLATLRKLDVEPVSYTHLDVYKRQGGYSGYQLYHRRKLRYSQACPCTAWRRLCATAGSGKRGALDRLSAMCR